MTTTNQTLYEKINAYCNKGFYPIVKTGEKYFIVSPHRDYFGNWRESSLESFVDTAETRIGLVSGATMSSWYDREEEGYKIVRFHSPLIARFEKSDLVTVCDNLASRRYGVHNRSGWREKAGQVGTVTAVWSNDYELTFADGSSESFSHDQLLPYFKSNT